MMEIDVSFIAASICVVLICTVVQNIFGVGILVFGTPLLLILGYNFIDILCILCPSSMCVSLIQLLANRDKKIFNLRFAVSSIIGVITGMILFQMFAVPSFLYFLVAIIMFVAASLRLSENLAGRFVVTVDKAGSAFYLLNGVFHGFCNLGGIFLVLRHSTRNAYKSNGIVDTAFIYLIYVVCQSIFLYFYFDAKLLPFGFLLAPVMGFVTVLLIKTSFVTTVNRQVDIALATFFIVVGSVLLGKISF